MTAATWEEFTAAEPEMAKVLRHLLGWIPIAYLATVRRDGAPRVHPVVPVFANEGMFVAVRPHSPKRHDLRNDGRFALHALPGKRDDEFYMTGRAALVEDAEARKAVVAAAKHTIHPDDDVFDLRAEYVMTAHWENMGQPDTYPVRQEWRRVGARRGGPNGAGPGRRRVGALLAAPKRTPSNTPAKPPITAKRVKAKTTGRAASVSRATRK